MRIINATLDLVRARCAVHLLGLVQRVVHLARISRGVRVRAAYERSEHRVVAQLHFGGLATLRPADQAIGRAEDVAAQRTGVSVPKVLRSEEHTYELQSLMCISYAVFCLTTKNRNHLIPS